MPKPVNNIADFAKGMWIDLARKPQWLCLIPVTGFAKAEAEKGRMTRWFALKDQPDFAWAGLWRISNEWGRSPPAPMTDVNEAIQPVHNRMPVSYMPTSINNGFRAAVMRRLPRSERFRSSW